VREQKYLQRTGRVGALLKNFVEHHPILVLSKKLSGVLKINKVLDVKLLKIKSYLLIDSQLRELLAKKLAGTPIKIPKR
jgi:hypothetical protein